MGQISRLIIFVWWLILEVPAVYGAALVERFASHKGYVVIGLTTPKQRLEITVTPTGIVRLGIPVKNEERAIIQDL